MEGYTGHSYPDSGTSSPHSRDFDFDNNQPPQSLEDQPPNHKVKFLVSYGGKIQPRPHDNQLSYIGGDTKILSVDRNIKFSTLLSKLSSLLSQDSTFHNSLPSVTLLTSFKYQLPDEQLDALISVTNDDDLEHMMHEYDRLFRASPRPARLRLFAFPGPHLGFGPSGSETGSEPGKVFGDPTNPTPVPGSRPGPALGQDHHGPASKVDFLFGLGNRVVGPGPGYSDRVVGSGPDVDLGRLHVSNRLPVEQTPAPITPPGHWKPRNIENQPPPPPHQQNHQFYVMHAPPRSDGLFHAPPHQEGMFHAPPRADGMFYAPPHQEGMFHAPVSSGGGCHVAVTSGGGFHAPVMRPGTGQPVQGYYQIQRVPSDAAAGVYREQPVVHAGGPGMGVQLRPVAGVEENDNNNRSGGYHMAYDSVGGRQIYYSAPPGIMTAPFHGGGGGGQSQASSGEGKVVHHKI